jgi:hypothetical protein
VPSWSSLQARDVVDDLAGALGGGAARVVADHPAERAVGVGGRLRPVPQLMLAELLVQHVEHDARLDYARPLIRVDGDQPVTVLRPVDQHSGIGALPGQAGSPATRDDRRPVLAAHADRLDRRLDRAGGDDADRDLPEVRGIGRVGTACAGVEAHLAVDRGGEVTLQVVPVRRVAGYRGLL